MNVWPLCHISPSHIYGDWVCSLVLLDPWGVAGTTGRYPNMWQSVSPKKDVTLLHQHNSFSTVALNQADWFCTQRILGNVWRHFCHHWGVGTTGIERVEAKAAAQHTLRPNSTENYPATCQQSHGQEAALQGKKYTSQFSLQRKGAVTVEDYWTERQYYDIVWVCFVFGNCNHCCFCCGHPFTMLGVSLFIACKNKIQCVCVKKNNKNSTANW